MDLKILNLPTNEIYKDLLQPGMKKVGEALSTVFDLSNLILLPLKLVNEKSKQYFDANLKAYSEKLNKQDQAVTQVPQYIGLPILDKLTYLDRNELSEAFLNLLTKASFDESLNLAHPAFVTILNNLSVDEAKILVHYKDCKRIPFIDIYIHKFKENIPLPNQTQNGRKSIQEIKDMIDYDFQNRESVYIKAAWNLAGIENDVELFFPKNVDIYIENLLQNGIIFIESEVLHKDDTERYSFLSENIYKNVYADLNESLETLKKESEFKAELETRLLSFQFTELGKSFLKACIIE